jgi:BirA family biotin operon repressor/biotin-[acetyl-CoA-carboxylase] ligase
LEASAKTETATLEPRPASDEISAIVSLDEVGSVLDEAWALEAKNSWPVFGSVLAASQTAGRGRRGSVWSSPPGHVYAALRLPSAPPFDGSQAPLALALFLTLALEELFGLDVLIKWPNDLTLDGRKVGGLLLESRRGSVAAGVGLNLGSPPTVCERDPAAPPVGALPAALGPPKRLWEKLATDVQKRYNRHFAVAPPGWAERLASLAETRLAGLGRRATALEPASDPPLEFAAGDAPTSVTGRVVGLDPSGALRLETSFGLLRIWAGSLTFEL